MAKKTQYGLGHTRLTVPGRPDLTNKTAVVMVGDKTLEEALEGAGTSDYPDLTNKPSINGVELSGNKTSSDLGVATSQQGAKADTAYQKPQTGIPESDLSSGVQQALQKHFKGWFDTLAELKAAHTATEGDSAYVKDTSPATTWSIYVYDSTASSNKYWADSGTDADTSHVQTFASGEEVNETSIDDTHLVNPADGALPTADDVLQLKAKLEGVTATETKVTEYTLQVGVLNASTKEFVGTSGTSRYAVIPVGEAKRVRFLGVSYGDANTQYNYGFGFYNSSDEIFWTQRYEGRNDSGNNVVKEYAVDIPDGAVSLICSVVLASNTLNESNFYCYMQSGESVVDMMPKIVNNLIDGGVDDVLSAEQGKIIADTTMELVESKNLLNPNDIDTTHRINRAGEVKTIGTSIAVYGCTDYIPIGDEGLRANHCVVTSGTLYCAACVYDVNHLYIGYVYVANNGDARYISKDTSLNGTPTEGADTENPYYVRFNFYNPASVEGGVPYDGVTDGYAVYRDITLPSVFQPWFEPYWKQKDAIIQDGAITTSKIADAAVTIDKMADMEVNPVTDNICNPEECTFDGHYIYGTSGNVSSSTNSGYAGYTGYIPIDERGVYCNGSKVSGNVIGYAYYSDKNTQSYIDGYYKGHHPEGCTMNYAAYITGAKYVRFSIAPGYSAETIMANIGNKEKPYVEYDGFKKTISKEILPNDEANIDNILQQEKIYTDALKVALPDKFYAVRGDILQLFHKGVVYAIDFANRYAMPTCSKGTQYRRYYELNTTKVVFAMPSSASVFVGDVYSTQGNTYEVTKVATEGSSKNITCAFKGSATITSSGTLTKISGSGDASVTYTKFTDTVAAGEYPYTLTVYDDNRNILGEGSSIIKLVNFPTAPQSTKRILCIGASTTAGGQWVCEAQRRLLGTGVNPTYENSPKGDGLDSTKIKFIGSLSKTLYGQTASFFAKSGWAWEDFATAGRYAIRFYLEGNNHVTIGTKYTNNGHTYEVIELNTIDGVETIRCSTASGNTPNPHGDNVNGTLTLSSGDGDATLTYTKSEVDGANPFWNNALETPALDFNNYVENICSETSLDMMIIVLGANAMFSTTLEQQEEYVRTFIEACHTDYPDCKIILVGSSSPSMINMMPGYGVGCSSFGNTYFVKCRLLDIFEMYKTIAADYDYVEYESWAGQFDSDYNFPLSQKDVNIRNNSVQEPYANNTIHPGNPGYMQFADAAYRSIVAHLCQ